MVPKHSNFYISKRLEILFGKISLKNFKEKSSITTDSLMLISSELLVLKYFTNIKKNLFNCKYQKNALAGNRTRAARVAGEHSTTEPPVRTQSKPLHFLIKF